MAKETIEVLIEGGKATAAPPLGPALGPMGVNIGQVVAEINKKTASFKGMQVPVKVIIDTETKAFDIAVGTPPASALIKKEAGIKKGSGVPQSDYVADLKIEQIIKIAQMKESNLLGKNAHSRVKEIIGTCDSMGVMVEGVDAREAIKQVNEGKFDSEITSGKTELSAEELKEQEVEQKKMQEEIEKKRSEFETKAKDVLAAMKGKSKSDIKAKMIEAGVPVQIFEPLLPVDEKKADATATKPAEAKK